METLRQVYRRLDRLQRDRIIKIVLSVLALLVAGGFFGALILTNNDLQAQRDALTAALAASATDDTQTLALNLLETGTVTVDGETYGGPTFRTYANRYIDAGGNVANPGALASDLVAPRAPTWAPRWLLIQPETTWMLAIIVIAWLLLVIWLEITLPLILTLIATGVPVLIGLIAQSTQTILFFGGLGLLAFTFIMLMRALLVIFNPAHPMLAVAHNVIKEATRTRMGLVFITILLVLLPALPLNMPILPFALDPEDPLQYRMQTFLSWSLGLTFSIAACLTLFLSCATVAFEIRDRQIWQVVAKPINRAQYLLGKWLGVAAVNLVILVVAGVSAFTFIKYLSTTGAQGFSDREILDRMAVQEEVLTARVPTYPVYETLSNEQVTAWVDNFIENDPALSKMEQVPLAERRRLRNKVQEAFAAQQRSVPPQQDRTYLFTGLLSAKELNSTLYFKYKFHILQDDEHQVFPARFMLNGDPTTVTERRYVPTVMHAMPIVSDHVTDDGELTISVRNDYANPNLVGHLNWDADQFLIMYKVATFESNFFRALLAMWIKLIFLAALAVAASTFLSFPVACMLSFTVFFAGMLGPFLAESLELYVPPETGDVEWSNIGMIISWAFSSFVRFIAEIIVFLLRGFGELRPAQALVEGRYISWTLLGSGFLKLGVLWSGLAMIVGWLVMRSRQLAIYSGQG